ncbi:natterin-3-like isoform X2 [Centropristis striata]|uniref:natterin-3-like isoform X2 n=1 Tax=Centropristis striata TaxID=184440 RepID=UPI0027E13F00|nr:natterin-3-like isoform X2 [Centropristis striata]XP_059194068.1 natterin-3-like isoform X2 [Centropristis striata]XP_059194069.1 natterin-3-like isoform X2 [Centropristis striata]
MAQGGIKNLDLDQTSLEWQTFNGSLPNGAVSIYNGYCGRTDYVCKYGIEAGFYNPSKGPHCHYPYGDKELRGSPFEILVNKDNFEFLEWKDDCYGSVPQNSVYTSPNKDVCVGKNKYGLGKVHVKHEAFFLPWEGSEYWYKYYQVLTVNRDIISEDISDVKYKTNGVQVIQDPPKTMNLSIITNKGCQEVTQTTTIEKMSQVEQRWDTSFSFTVGARTTITAGIPLIANVDIEYSMETTFQFTKGTTHTESTAHKVSVEHIVPPNHSCTVTMVGRKHRADIPYTARLCRTYRNGETTWTSISGTYRGVQMGEVRAEVGRCVRLPGAMPCH